MTTYYLRPTNGNDGNAGTSHAAAFQTLQKCADTATAGDEVRMEPEATETTSASVDFDTNAGTTTNPILWVPASTSDGSVDYSLNYTIQASASITGLLDFTGSADYNIFHNLIVDGNSNATTPLYNNVDGCDGNRFHNCRFTGGTGDGINVRGTDSSFGWQFWGCEVDSNGGDGIGHILANRGIIFFYYGKIHDNTSNGWSVDRTACECVHNQIYDNGADGIKLISNSYYARILNNTVYGNSGDGLEFFNATSRVGYRVVNNTFTDNGGYGVNFQVTDTDVAAFMDYNHTHNNTSGVSDQTLPGNNNVTGDPLFVSTTDGSEDFLLQASSPLFKAGMNGTNIGALGPTNDSAGGGGGGAIVNQGLQAIESGITA